MNQRTSPDFDHTTIDSTNVTGTATADAKYPEYVPARSDSPDAHAQPIPARSRSWWARMGHNIARDTVLVAPGIFISLIAVPVLLTLFFLAIGTLPIWVGVLILPLALIVASAFAHVSRARARRWGAPIAEVVRGPRERGIRGWVGIVKDGRRWLDLFFESVFALPIRILGFVVSLTWFAGALGGLSYFFWGMFLPDDSTGLPELIAAAWTNTPIGSFDYGFGVDATFQFLTGLVFLVSFPFVLHAMALLEISAIRAGLAPGSSPETGPVSGSGWGPSSGAGPNTGPGVGFGPSLGPNGPSPEANGTSSTSTAATSSNTASLAQAMPSLAGANGWFWLSSIFAGLVLVAVAWPVLAVAYGVWTVYAMLITIAQSAAIVLSVRWPGVGIAVGLLSSSTGILLTTSTVGPPWPWNVPAMLALLFVHIVIGLRHSWVYLVILFALIAGLSAGSLFIPHAGSLPGALSNAITFASLSAGVSLLVLLLRLWLKNRGELASVRRLSAEELAKRQNLEERNRIAQELHDVVAHSMSVISVQATTARYRRPDLDPSSVEEFESIAGSARQALTEMRGLLSILRGGRDVELAPQPEVGDIPDLVAATRDSGAHVELDFPAGLPTGFDSELPNGSGIGLPPELEGLSPTTGLTAFRIVQEGLANALRHAPGSAVQVTVRTEDALLLVSVFNGPAPATTVGAGTGANTGTGFHLGESDRDEGTGFGLRGMHERVEALGGTLQVGPTTEGGFEVVARLPLG